MLGNAIRAFRRKQMGWAFGNLLAVFCSVACWFILPETLPAMIISGRDRWADNLSIPGQLPLAIPARLDEQGQRPDSIIHRAHLPHDFQVYQSFQPGLFEYDCWLGPTDSGVVFLSATEVTTGKSLSAEYLPQTTRISVGNASANLQRFSTNHHFTIYEGDWGAPYAARFTLWYRAAKDSTAIKLSEQVYEIEGWMR